MCIYTNTIQKYITSMYTYIYIYIREIYKYIYIYVAYTYGKSIHAICFVVHAFGTAYLPTVRYYLPYGTI